MYQFTLNALKKINSILIYILAIEAIGGFILLLITKKLTIL